MSKRKKSLPTLSELHFVSSLPLEAALDFIADYADDGLEVTITEVTPDIYTFRVVHKEGFKIMAQLTGKGQRWQGTSTRIDCDGTIGADKIHWGVPATLSFIALLVSAGMLFNGTSISIVISLLAMMLVGAFMLFLIIYNESILSVKSSPHFIRQHRDLENLLDTFTDVFRQHGTIELLDKRAKPVYEHYSDTQRDYPQQSRRGTDAATPHHRRYDLSDDEKSRQARNRRG